MATCPPAVQGSLQYMRALPARPRPRGQGSMEAAVGGNHSLCPGQRLARGAQALGSSGELCGGAYKGLSGQDQLKAVLSCFQQDLVPVHPTHCG